MDLTQILPQFGNLAFTLLAFIVALSVIVAVHEFGHYIVARWTGIHSEVFSIGFGPVIWSRVDRRGTRWQIAALPLGGYVKFLGDANAASVGSDMERVAPRDRRHTMLGAPLWARAATVAAGPVFNFILSLVIFAAVLLVSGTPRDPLTVATLLPLPPEYAHELQPGDEILAIDGEALGAGVLTAGAMTPTVPYLIRRNGAQQTVPGPNPALPVVGSVNPGSAAYHGGMRTGDVITAISGNPVTTFSEIVTAVGESNGDPLTFRIWRPGSGEDEMTLLPRREDLPRAEGGFESRWLIGVVSGSAITPVTESPGLFTAIGNAAAQIWFIITSSLSGLWHIVTGAISTCNLSGPVGIAETSGAMASMGASSFIWFLAVLSTAVGLLNLFPVPILDGGHLVFHAWEAVTGRPPSDTALRILMSIGVTAILFLMVFAVMNDLFLCR